MVTRKLLTILAAAFLALTAAAQTDALRLRIDGNNYYDEAIVRFVSEATPGYDANYDAWKLFSPNAQVPSLYTRIDSVSPLSINALPSLDGRTSVDVYADVNVAGTYTITPTEAGAFQPGVCITLEDIATGNYYDMRSGVTPSFSLTAGNNGQPRFRLHFTTPVSFSVSNVLCYGGNDGVIMLNKEGIVNWSYSLSDSAGNTVTSGTGIIEGDTLVGLAAGTYTLTSMAPFGCPETTSIAVGQPASLQPSFTVSDSVVYQSQAMIHFSNTSVAGSAFTWDFGDGSPVSNQQSPSYTYGTSGNFTVMLTATNGSCQETASRNVSVLPDVTTGAEEISDSEVTVFVAGRSLVIEGIGPVQGEVSLFDISGREVMDRKMVQGPKAAIDLYLPGGYYFARIIHNESISVKKIFLGVQ